MQDNKQHLEPDMEKWTGSKLGKEYIKAIYFYLTLTSMLSISCKMPGWMKHNLESRLPDDTALMAESKEELKSLLMKVKEESENTWLKIHSKN